MTARMHRAITERTATHHAAVYVDEQGVLVHDTWHGGLPPVDLRAIDAPELRTLPTPETREVFPSTWPEWKADNVGTEFSRPRRRMSLWQWIVYRAWIARAAFAAWRLASVRIELDQLQAADMPTSATAVRWMQQERQLRAVWLHCETQAALAAQGARR